MADDIKAKAIEQGQKLLAWGKTAAHKFQQDLDKIDFLHKAEETTHIPKIALVGVVALFALSLFMFNAGAQFIVNVVGFLYPAYVSFRAIETGNTAESTLWLRYWVVFGFLNLGDFFSEFLTYWIPFYYPMKLVLIVYLIHPKFRGVVHLKDAVQKVAHLVITKVEKK